MQADEAVRAAILSGDLSALQALQAENVRILLDGGDDLNGLMLAASAGHRAILEVLLAAGADPRQTRANSFTALHAAAMEGYADLVELLCRAGADPNAQTSPQKYTPLHSAAFAGHDAVVEVLLAHGASTELTNYRGEKPADTARRNKHASTVALIGAAQARGTEGGDVDDAAGLSPAITAFSWGRIEVAGGRIFKDARLYPGGAEEWDWRKTGTRHDPGIQFADAEDLLRYDPATVILSRGVNLVLKVPEKTIEAIRAEGPEVIVLQSEKAVAEYNRHRASEAVVALIHSTC
jgi:hypothetical protein